MHRRQYLLRARRPGPHAAARFRLPRGVTRSLVLELGPAAGIEVEEQTLFPEDIYCSDEVFISSTNRNVIGVAEVGGHATKTPLGPVTRRIEDAFEAYVRDYVDAHAAVTGER